MAFAYLPDMNPLFHQKIRLLNYRAIALYRLLLHHANTVRRRRHQTGLSQENPDFQGLLAFQTYRNLGNVIGDGISGKTGHKIGLGSVCILRQDPKEFVLTAGADAPLMAAVSAAYGPLEQKNHFLLHRGPYTVGAVMDESVSEAPLKVDGTLIDLYDPELPVLREKTIGPGEQFFLYDVRKAPKAPAVLAASSRESDVKAGKDSYSYIAKGPADTYNISRILLPSAPVQVLVGGADAPYTWNEGSRTLLVRFPNSPDGVTVQIRWK